MVVFGRFFVIKGVALGFAPFFKLAVKSIFIYLPVETFGECCDRRNGWVKVAGEKVIGMVRLILH